MFTRREKIVLGIFGAAFVIVTAIVILFPDWIGSAAEFVYLLLVVIPIGWLLATDKERIKESVETNEE